VGKPEGKTTLERPRRRKEDNIKLELQKVGCGGLDWIDLTKGRDRWWVVVNAVMNFSVP
jgi:ribosome biogenesis protein Nip4